MDRRTRADGRKKQRAHDGGHGWQVMRSLKATASDHFWRSVLRPPESRHLQGTFIDVPRERERVREREREKESSSRGECIYTYTHVHSHTHAHVYTPHAHMEDVDTHTCKVHARGWVFSELSLG